MSEARKLDLLDEDEQQEQDEDIAVFDDASAEYLMDYIRRADAEYERMEAWYEKQLTKAKEVHERKVAWAERNLRAYFDLVPKKYTKTQQSYELPSGKLVLKDQQPEYTRDEDALVGWLEQNGMGDLVKVTKKSSWADLKKILKEDGDRMVTADGEIVPGIKVEHRLPKFSATPNKK